ncbi:proton channel OtopLc-like [Ischnura elegans]|uniref:proton channel OtopLc-like n=1 Tax=Ischnura elegans TaxID=197161 RepID=UPI001ED8AD38|nr:proton channel OtopLc-like [Ischnura elegans]
MCRYLTVILSCIYAVFIVTLGIVIYISDLVSAESIMAEVFSIYLMSMGLLWLIFIYMDIKRHLKRKDITASNMRAEYSVGKTGSSRESMHYQVNNERDLHLALQMPWTTMPPYSRTSSSSLHSGSEAMINSNEGKHGYCFSQGRHSGSFYLKAGAAGFCFGHLIHSGLLLGHQIVFFTSDSEEFANCANVATLVLDIIYPTYSFFQLFFIFKYSNVIINRCQELAKFALMHCIASSLCFWIWTILRETMDSLHHTATSNNHHDSRRDSPEDDNYAEASAHESISTSTFWEESEKLSISTPSSKFENLDILSSLPLTSYKERGAKDLFHFLNSSTYFSHNCRGTTHLSTIFDNISPYLYPFTIEYSILVVGVLFIMWQNIGRCKTISTSSSCCGGYAGKLSSRLGADMRRCDRNEIYEWISSRSSAAPLSVGEWWLRNDGTLDHNKRERCHWTHSATHFRENYFTSNLVIHADCHSANKGLFAGLIILVGSVVSIILFFVAMADKEYVETGLVVNAITELTLLVVMTLTSGVAYHQISRLDINHHPVSFLDDLLLFLCIPAFFLYAIFSIVPAVEKTSYLSITNTILQVIQVLLQTPFIIDGLRRCSNSLHFQRLKPGRELITFLVVCNVAMWFIETFEIKSQAVRDDRNEFYGSVLWTMLSHMTLPLTMFYRFHSSVCLVDIWKSAYEPGG